MNCFFPQNMRQKSAKVKLYRLIGIILYLQKTPDNTHLLTPSSPMFSTIYSHSLRFNQNSIFLARFSLVSSLTFFPIFWSFCSFAAQTRSSPPQSLYNSYTTLISWFKTDRNRHSAQYYHYHYKNLLKLTSDIFHFWKTSFFIYFFSTLLTF